MRKLIFLISITLVLSTCKTVTTYQTTLQNPELFRKCMQKLTDVIVHDIFSPPVASRVYVYPTIAAYEALIPSTNQEYSSFAGQLSSLETVPEVDNDYINYHLSSIHAFLEVGRTLIFTEDKILSFQNALYQQLEREGLPTKVKEASLTYGQEVANHILQWAKSDNYNQTRNYPKYTILEGKEFWKPTPPDYMDGIEPHWNKIRPLVLDSARQYKPLEPHTFSLEENSAFFKQLMEVYTVGKELSKEEEEIAKFWDCNPYVSQHHGHAMFATKKITPGGHWVGITAIATRQSNSNFTSTVEAYAMVTISLFDAFISCWDEKWRTIVVRPETVINEHLDEEWMPLLQTPPFPEYTSGHSVISRASAVTLTKLFGNQFAFNDTTEVAYGLPERQFASFIHASEEAAISRLYGGIHYRMAIDNGVTQGQGVGEYINKKLITRIQEKHVSTN